MARLASHTGTTTRLTTGYGTPTVGDHERVLGRLGAKRPGEDAGDDHGEDVRGDHRDEEAVLPPAARRRGHRRRRVEPEVDMVVRRSRRPPGVGDRPADAVHPTVFHDRGGGSPRVDLIQQRHGGAHPFTQSETTVLHRVTPCRGGSHRFFGLF